MDDSLAIKNYITDADKQFFYATLMNHLKDYSDVYKIKFEKRVVDYITSDEYLFSEVLVDDDCPKIVFGVSGYEPLENWLFKDVSYIKRAKELHKLIEDGKLEIAKLLDLRDSNSPEFSQSKLDELSKLQSQYNLELSSLEIDNTFFRREKIFEKVDMALVFALTPHAEHNETLKEICRLINEHLIDRSGYMRDEKKLQDDLNDALLNENVGSIKFNIDEIDNRRTTRRRDMLTLGTCTLVKTNQ